jgi:hypothetical protein
MELVDTPGWTSRVFRPGAPSPHPRPASPLGVTLPPDSVHPWRPAAPTAPSPHQQRPPAEDASAADPRAKAGPRQPVQHLPTGPVRLPATVHSPAADAFFGPLRRGPPATWMSKRGDGPVFVDTKARTAPTNASPGIAHP